MIKYIKLIRIKHYIKNFLIFLPLIFSRNINATNILLSILGFISFSFASSIIYIINDIRDKEKDKNHPTKKNRPIAAGTISITNALIVATLLLIITIAILIYLSTFNKFISIYIITYILINIMYSFGLKNIPLLDVFILALGFLIRVLYGGALINVEVSNWLFLTVLSISFYLGLGKRRNELIAQEKTGNTTRNVLKYYNKEFLDKNMYMCLSMTIIFYSLWCQDLNSDYIMWTIPIVLLICMKYSLNIESNSSGDPVEVLLKDKILILLVGIYAFAIFLTLYVLR